MKQFILFTFLLMPIANNIAASTTVYLLKDPQYPGPRPRFLSYIPASSTISTTDLSVCFDSHVCTSTITVYNSFDQMVDPGVVAVN